MKEDENCEGIKLFGKRKIKKREVDEEILNKIRQYQTNWNHINELMKNSLEPSESSLYDQAVSKSKYFFLLREARSRNLKGKL